MTFLVATVALVGGPVGAWVFGRAWGAVLGRLGRFGPLLAFVEPFLAIGGFAASTGATAAALLVAARVPLSALNGPVRLGEPAYLAAILGTVVGQLAVLGWGRARGVELGLGRPTASWLWGLGAGAGGLLVSGVLTVATDALGHSLDDQGIVQDVRDAPPGLAAALLVLVVGVAPLLEELVFRGYFQAAFGERLGKTTGIAVTAVIFGLFHLADPWVVLPVILLGLMLGVARARTGSVWPGVLGHVLNNAVALLLTL